MSIPIVDFSLPEAELAPEIDRICRDIGFFVLVNHGVPQSVIDRLHALAVEFFDLPQAEKLKVARPKPELNRGFIASGSESLARLNGGGAGMAADYKEVFTIGPIDFPDDPYFTCPDAYPSFYPNLWPERPTGLRAAMTDYWRELGLVEARMMQIFALALGLPTDFFLKRIDKRTNHLRLIDYPPYTGQPLPGQLRAGVHTDLGMFGMVNQNNNIAGLEVRDRNGNWIAPPTLREGFICNLGDLIARWTNLRWVSTPHRVANPSSSMGENSRRTSLVYFTIPNYDAVIECLPTCVDDNRRPQFEPITVDAYRRDRFARTFNAG